jgi:hypothetical protein
MVGQVSASNEVALHAQAATPALRLSICIDELSEALFCLLLSLKAGDCLLLAYYEQLREVL